MPLVSKQKGEPSAFLYLKRSAENPLKLSRAALRVLGGTYMMTYIIFGIYFCLVLVGANMFSKNIDAIVPKKGKLEDQEDRFNMVRYLRYHKTVSYLAIYMIVKGMLFLAAIAIRKGSSGMGSDMGEAALIATLIAAAVAFLGGRITERLWESHPNHPAESKKANGMAQKTPYPVFVRFGAFSVPDWEQTFVEKRAVTAMILTAIEISSMTFFIFL